MSVAPVENPRRCGGNVSAVGGGWWALGRWALGEPSKSYKKSITVKRDWEVGRELTSVGVRFCVLCEAPYGNGATARTALSATAGA